MSLFFPYNGNVQSNSHLKKGKISVRELRDKANRIVKFHVSVVKPKRGIIKFRIKATIKALPNQPSYIIDKRVDNETELELYLQKWARENNPDDCGFRSVWTDLTTLQIAEAKQAFQALPQDCTLLEAVNFFAANKNIVRLTVREAYESWKKENHSNWGIKTKQSKETNLKDFITRFSNRNVSTIRGDELDSVFLNIPKSTQTKYNRYRELRAFFNFCKRKKYVLNNPMEEHVAPNVLKNSRPKVLTIDQAKNLFYASCDPKYESLLPFVTLGLFCGIRPSEIHGGILGKSPKNYPTIKTMDWNDIFLEPEIGNPYINLPFLGKMASGRRIEIPPNAAETLKYCREKGLYIFPLKNSGRLWSGLRKSVSLQGTKSEWVPDIMRHTAISMVYLLNPFDQEKRMSEAEISAMFGNSEYVRQRYYLDTSKFNLSEAHEFWNLKIES